MNETDVRQVRNSIGGKKLLLFCFSILTCFVFCINFKKYSFDEKSIFLQFHKILPMGNDFMWLFLIVGVFFVYQHAFSIQVQRKTKITLGITSAFFAAFTIIGILCETFERWEIDSTLFFILMVTYFAYFSIIYAILKMIFYHLFEKNTPPTHTINLHLKYYYFLTLTHLHVLFSLR